VLVVLHSSLAYYFMFHTTISAVRQMTFDRCKTRKAPVTFNYGCNPLETVAPPLLSSPITMGNAAHKAAKPVAAAARTYPKTIVQAADVAAKSDRLQAAAARVCF
jgi:hypothetical protein